MKKYSIFDLSVVELTNTNIPFQHFICKYNEIFGTYNEIFTNIKFKSEEVSNVEPLSKYYSIFESQNYNTGKPLMLTKKDLLLKHNEINYANLLLTNDKVYHKHLSKNPKNNN